MAEDYEKIGFRFAKGAMTAFAMFYLVGTAFMWVSGQIWPPVSDDSDAPGKRSGFAVHRDALTGCEYVSAPKGGISPRLNASGAQVCR